MRLIWVSDYIYTGRGGGLLAHDQEVLGSAPPTSTFWLQL